MERPQERRVTIALLIDALGWEIAERHQAFRETCPVHRAPLDSVLGYSSACIPSILTGLYPEEHGHWSFFYYAPDRSPFGWLRPFDWIPEPILERFGIRRALSRRAAARAGYTGYFQLYAMPLRHMGLFDTCEPRDIWKPGGLAPAVSIIDRLEAARIPYFLSLYPTPDRQGVERAKAALDRRAVRVVFLYLAELDGFLHGHVGRPDLVRDRIHQLERWVGELLRAASGYEEAELLLFSDHGMTPTVGTIDLRPRLRSARVRAWRDYIPLLDSTMARFYFETDAARRAVWSALEGVPHGHWLSAEEKARWRVRFPGDRFGHEIFLCDPGWCIAPSHMGRHAPPGMHGFDPRAPHSRAFVATNGRPVTGITDITDLHHFVMASATAGAAASTEVVARV